MYVWVGVCWDTRHVHRTNTHTRTHTTAQVRALHSALTPFPTGLPRLFIGRTRTATFTLVPLMAAKCQTKSGGREHQLINIANKSKSIEFYAHIRHTPAWPEQARDISLSPERRPFWDDFLKWGHVPLFIAGLKWCNGLWMEDLFPTAGSVCTPRLSFPWSVAAAGPQGTDWASWRTVTASAAASPCLIV